MLNGTKYSYRLVPPPDPPSSTEGFVVHSLPSGVDKHCNDLETHRIHLRQLKKHIKLATYNRANERLCELRAEEEEWLEEQECLERRIEQNRGDIILLEKKQADHDDDFQKKMAHLAELARRKDYLQREEEKLVKELADYEEQISNLKTKEEEQRKGLSRLARQIGHKQDTILLLEKTRTGQEDDHRKKQARLLELTQREEFLQYEGEQMVRKLVDYEKLIQQKQNSVLLIEHQATAQREENQDKQSLLCELIQEEQKLQFESHVKKQEYKRLEIQVAQKESSVALLEQQETEHKEENRGQNRLLCYEAPRQLVLEYEEHMDIELPSSEGQRPHCTDLVPAPTLALVQHNGRVVAFKRKTDTKPKVSKKACKAKYSNDKRRCFRSFDDID